MADNTQDAPTTRAGELGFEDLELDEFIEEEDTLALANLSKALGHPARVAIIRLLAGQDRCVAGEIVEELPLAQSTVSQHLQKLKKAGLISSKSEGTKTLYCLEPGALDRLKQLLGQL